ncbi:MAG: hypothetical protein C7B45_09965 [Sulfobacillus acidophilus]|uniref:Uncharacterized protein n=1 Tax=Sulfobacillus acidophilus TaxID=53633 RepID=A0A2T2WHC0_9FIRM|nr:MAG: hypothetical protein C7B45_09965 [Sulfobacillus acidophilus]
MPKIGYAEIPRSILVKAWQPGAFGHRDAGDFGITAFPDMFLQSVQDAQRHYTTHDISLVKFRWARCRSSAKLNCDKCVKLA